MSFILEQLFFDFMSSTEFLVRIVFTFNFAFSAVSSGNIFYYTIFCSTFLLAFCVF